MNAQESPATVFFIGPFNHELKYFFSHAPCTTQQAHNAQSSIAWRPVRTVWVCTSQTGDVVGTGLIFGGDCDLMNEKNIACFWQAHRICEPGRAALGKQRGLDEVYA